MACRAWRGVVLSADDPKFIRSPAGAICRFSWGSSAGFKENLDTSSTGVSGLAYTLDEARLYHSCSSAGRASKGDAFDQIAECESSLMGTIQNSKGRILTENNEAPPFKSSTQAKQKWKRKEQRSQ
ncbi:Hypothetical predicted protein [Podarcis lilfordi]|uniref:Uncharacterized protein n=1 Tax=Podarcis lilfordi TaxID=74358 RepID=A0AA35PGQ6_9SAUR|nr:Hypothetical predicted protein [Podarcis lilfordi]